MSNRINEEMLAHIGILAKLELAEDEKEQVAGDMEKMLDYVDKLSELDTEGVEPDIHMNNLQNVFREDEVINGNNREDMLRNAPEKKDGQYVVPRTF